MGQSQSQNIDRFVSNYVNTQLLSEVITRYATSTNSINRNVQDFYLDVDARDIQGGVNVMQNITSVINVRQMVNRANTANLTNDVQQAITSELRAAVTRMTDGLGELFSRPTNQAIRDTVLNNMDTYVRNVVTTENIDDLILSSDNVQNQRIVLRARDITGGLNFNQQIQSSIIADNMIETVVNNMIDNADVKALANIVDESIEQQAVSPITEGIRQIGKSLFSGVNIIIIGIIVLIFLIGIGLAIFLPVSGIIKIVIMIITIALVAAGIAYWYRRVKIM